MLLRQRLLRWKGTTLVLLGGSKSWEAVLKGRPDASAWSGCRAENISGGLGRWDDGWLLQAHARVQVNSDDLERADPAGEPSRRNERGSKGTSEKRASHGYLAIYVGIHNQDDAHAEL